MADRCTTCQTSDLDAPYEYPYISLIHGLSPGRVE
jgi:hypothetical protein